MLLSMAAKTIGGAQVVIAVYNTAELEKTKHKFKSIYANFEKVIKRAELSAISAAIQNMVLMAENLGVGSCWLDMPLFCAKEIDTFLKMNDELMAVVTLGYPAEEGKRAVRKDFSEAVKYIK